MDTSEPLAEKASAKVNALSGAASSVTERSLTAWDSAMDQATDATFWAHSTTVNYAQAEPGKALLIAAAAGAALMGVLMLLIRS